MDHDLRLEDLGVRPSHQAVDPVRPDDEIGALEFFEVMDLVLELQPDAERLAAALQDVEQNFPRDAGEHMAAGADLRIAVVNVDRVPAGEALADLGIGVVVGVAQRPKRFFRKHHPPTKGRVRRVSLDDPHLVARVGLLGQQREVQSGGAAADDGVAHRLSESPRRDGRPDRAGRRSEIERARRSRRLRSHG